MFVTTFEKRACVLKCGAVRNLPDVGKGQPIRSGAISQMLLEAGLRVRCPQLPECGFFSTGGALVRNSVGTGFVVRFVVWRPFVTLL